MYLDLMLENVLPSTLKENYKMNTLIWFIDETRWFIKSSRQYMRGEKVSPMYAFRSYLTYLKLSYSDYKAGYYMPPKHRRK